MAREETKAKFRTSIDFPVGSPIHPQSRGICHNAFKTIWRSQKQNSLVSSLSQQTLNETFTTRKQPLRPLGLNRPSTFHLTLLTSVTTSPALTTFPLLPPKTLASSSLVPTPSSVPPEVSPPVWPFSPSPPAPRCSSQPGFLLIEVRSWLAGPGWRKLVRRLVCPPLLDGRWRDESCGGLAVVSRTRRRGMGRSLSTGLRSRRRRMF
jgi:hypothetical protein